VTLARTLVLLTLAYLLADVSSPRVGGIFRMEGIESLSRVGVRRSQDVAAPVAVASPPATEIEPPAADPAAPIVSARRPAAPDRTAALRPRRLLHAPDLGRPTGEG